MSFPFPLDYIRSNSQAHKKICNYFCSHGNLITMGIPGAMHSSTSKATRMNVAATANRTQFRSRNLKTDSVGSTENRTEPRVPVTDISPLDISPRTFPPRTPPPRTFPPTSLSRTFPPPGLPPSPPHGQHFSNYRSHCASHYIVDRYDERPSRMKQCDYYERRHGINKDLKSFWIIIVHRQRTERYACTRSRTLIKLYKVAFTGQLCSVLLCQPWKSLDERKNAPRAIKKCCHWRTRHLDYVASSANNW